MNTIAVADIVRNIRDLPALPAIVLELIRTFGQEDVDIDTLAAKIARDQALAARTLRLANSSFYGLPSRVTTIGQAIVVLGFDAVRTLVAGSGIIGTLSAGGAQIDVAGFWRHSMATAVCARSLARHTGLNPENAFIAGLLHDIGRLVLATRFASGYGEVRAWRERGDGWLLEAEQAVLGIDHQQVGLMLAESWKFPLPIRRAIGNHHRPEAEDFGGLASVVHAANAIVHALDLAGEPDALVPPVMDAAWDSLRLDGAVLRAVFRDTCAEYEAASAMLAPPNKESQP